MTGQNLQESIRKRYPGAVCLGGVSYISLEGGCLAKVEFVPGGCGCDGVKVTVINRRVGPVDSLLIHYWDLPAHTRHEPQKGFQAWDVYRPTPDVEALLEMIEAYLHLFQGQR